VKPGYKTTEFWLSLAAVLIGAFVAGGFLPAEHLAVKIAGFVLTALAALGYTVSRAATKKAEVSARPQADVAATVLPSIMATLARQDMGAKGDGAVDGEAE